MKFHAKEGLPQQFFDIGRWTDFHTIINCSIYGTMKQYQNRYRIRVANASPVLNHNAGP